MRAELLICDFDNTLYDWVSYFVTSFYKMVEQAAGILEVEPDRLLSDFRAVHQRAGDSEHPFALLETQIVRQVHPALSRRELAEKLDSAFHAFNRSRKETLKLYPGVEDTLIKLADSGIRMVGHTEARALAVRDRLNRLGLDRYFGRVYCRERGDSEHPQHMDGQREIAALNTDIIELSHHQAKPSPDVLAEICEREGVRAERAAYVGDSLFKDIWMANRAGVYAIWAKYGTDHDNGTYAQLVRVSHWSDADIELERELRRTAGAIRPDATLELGFADILGVIQPGGAWSADEAVD